MSKNINNKVLVGVLASLAIIFLGTNYFRKNNNKTTLKTDIIAIDTSQVSKIRIQKVATNGTEITFSKSTQDWQVSQGTISSVMKPENINMILGQLTQLTIERLVAKTKDKWATYQLKDATAIKVIVEDNQGKPTTLYLGKIKYEKPANQYSQYNLNGSTYIRVNDDPKVYSAKGMLSNTFNRDFNSWRNSDFLKVDKNSVTKIQFDYPEEQRLILHKKDSVWNIGEIIADSTKVAQYLTTISYKNNSKFADTFIPKTKADYKIRIEGNNMNETIIEAYKDTIASKFYLKSTMNPQVFFESDSIGIFKQLFVSSDHFIK
ncbi:DUF4340 domain-containing protein [Aquimarina sp. RZ0]|uniref:DUF4340 domain-containing protein n=1 Tax=Aquimarina sp. RZ0 TaxID=2607730 RepID=UPI0011F0C071|nr:DUF4340 domain-containing protein [Aquimarina sp. RZ0]KAA1246638.1 DUF4340 domain-containing protein [Aquimarina sp. RZ0]